MLWLLGNLLGKKVWCYGVYCKFGFYNLILLKFEGEWVVYIIINF